MHRAAATTRKVVNATRRAIQNPVWLRETLRGKVRARADLKRPFVLAEHHRYLGTVERTVTVAYGISAERFRELSARVRVPVRDEDNWSGGDDMLTLTGVVVLLARPRSVVETGVAMGFTTAVILAAMEENGEGALHSVDLPPLQVDPDAFIGQVVPLELRSRWSLRVGPTRTVLPVLTPSVAPIDLFVHDSDHSYAGQLEDYRLAWPDIAAGGTLISDDVCNPAFIDFAAEVGERPWLIGSGEHDAAVGLLLKGAKTGG